MMYLKVEYLNLKRKMELKRYSNRTDFVCSFSRKKDDVLDIGCAQKTIIKGRRCYMHEFLAKAAKNCVGIDTNVDEVEEMNNMGFNIMTRSVYDLDIRRRFDVIYAGQVIEHLSNLDKFFETVRNHLKPNGIFVCDVPNTGYETIRLPLPLSRGHYPLYRNGGHVYTFNPYVLMQLLIRQNFEILEIGMIQKHCVEKILPRRFWRWIGCAAKLILDE